MQTVVPLLIALTAYTPMTQLQSRHLFTMTVGERRPDMVIYEVFEIL